MNINKDIDNIKSILDSIKSNKSLEDLILIHYKNNKKSLNLSSIDQE